MKKIILAVIMMCSMSTMAQKEEEISKFPVAEQARMKRLTAFLKVKGSENIEALLKSMIKDHPNVNLDMEKSLVSSAYAEDPNPAKVLQYVHAMEDPVFKVRALIMAIELMAPTDPAAALKLAATELAGVKKLKGQTVFSKPLKIDPKLAYNDYINLYGKLLFKAGKYDEAYPYTSEAYHSVKNRDAELSENYAFLSSLRGKYEEALPILSKSVQEGKFEHKYVEQVRKGYAKLNPDKDVDAYIAGLKSVFIEKIKTQVSKLMINETPPDFYLTDVNGKKVTLADFKGKTLVLDFWATWCGPCVASFPAMQMAVNRYKNDPNVKFLFIHTAENVADPLTDAKNFLAKRKHDFDLYMDMRDPKSKINPALVAFKIEGIPQKYVIDGNGRIRFSLSGFEGKDEAAAEEVVQMVELARK